MARESNELNEELVQEAVDRILLQEDIWSVVKWLLQKLGILRSPRRYQDYEVIDLKHVRGDTVGGFIGRALTRTLTPSDRKGVKVLPLVDRSKKLALVQTDIKAHDSNKFADKVVDYLTNLGGKKRT